MKKFINGGGEYQAPEIIDIVEVNSGSSVICTSDSSAGTEQFGDENMFDWGF